MPIDLEIYHAALFVRRPNLKPLEFDFFEQVEVTGIDEKDAFHAALTAIAAKYGYMLKRAEKESP